MIGIESHNPLNSAEILAQTRKLQDKQDWKTDSINGSWYFNKTSVMENDIYLEMSAL